MRKIYMIFLYVFLICIPVVRGMDSVPQEVIIKIIGFENQAPYSTKQLCSYLLLTLVNKVWYVVFRACLPTIISRCTQADKNRFLYNAVVGNIDVKMLSTLLQAGGSMHTLINITSTIPFYPYAGSNPEYDYVLERTDSAWFKAIELQAKDVIAYFLMHGALIDTQESSSGKTALMKTASLNNTEIVTLLLAHRASLNATCKNGKRAYQYASTDVIRALLDDPKNN